jgi:hypothetical protein
MHSFVKNPQGKRSLGRSRRRCEVNTES